MTIFTDQLGYKISLTATPERIISLVPSQTELLFDLGLDNEIVGITKYCIHPKEKTDHYKHSNAIVGGTKKLNIELIKQLNPNLIIGNKEENEKNQIEELKKYCPVWISNIQTLDASYDMIEQLGAIMGKKKTAEQLSKEIAAEFSSLKPIFQKKSVLYLIWRKPYIAAGSKTFIHHLLEKCGFKNYIDKIRYPEVTNNDIQTTYPDYIFLSSEPYPFKEKHIAELKAISPQSEVRLVDGELFSWYGSRLLHSPKYFNHLLSSLTA